MFATLDHHHYMYCSPQARPAQPLCAKRGFASLIPLPLLLAAGCFSFALNGFSLGQTQFVETSASRGSFTVAQGGKTATIYVDSADWPGVVRAANDLKADVNRVTGLTPTLVEDGKS